MRTGRVFLVGAGPGDPHLLTLRGAALLREADVVVLDALVDRRLLAHCRKGAAVIDAGKRGHGRVLMRQTAINRLLARLGRAGKRVVRLKGGDPYLFGRGGEEAAFLARARIPFEVVPGVSSVGAVPAAAGIPLTHRGLASTVTIVTGHGGEPNPYLRESGKERNGRRPPRVAWEKIPRDGTLVVLMGLGRLKEIVGELRRAGWPAATPAAGIASGTLPGQRSVRGTLGDIVARVRAAGLQPPATMVFGRVVSLSPRLNWFERRPLFGWTVLVTRAADQASGLTALLEEKGARVAEAPAIRIEPLTPSAAVRRALRSLSNFDGALFTSANAVRAAATRLRGPWPRGVPVYAVGPKTAEALRAAGWPVTRAAEEFRAEGLARILGKNLRGKSFLFPRAAEGRDVLIDFLEKAGARVVLWPVYRTRLLPPSPDVRARLRRGAFDAVTFTSSSTAHGLLGKLSAAERAKIFKRTRAASIGPITTAALRSLGVRPAVTALGATVESLVDALVRSRERP
ncbi:MAG: uroporphyrinogen-III C-methyltransferase [Elusimicrobia bacterium]|nr:uroporphyrinogen-III C-methyltransferase [Elusimicrobiota bacterium]